MTFTTPSCPAGVQSAEFAPFVASLLGSDAELLDVQTHALVGGLVAPRVLQLSVCFFDKRRNLRVQRFVMKQLDSSTEREARIYEVLSTSPARDAIPSLVGLDRSGPAPRLYLESVESASAWPWCRVAPAARVLERLAVLHQQHMNSLEPIAREWNYEQELESQAASTLEALERAYGLERSPKLGSGLRAARRIVAFLPRLRSELLHAGPLPSGIIHGDVHPGNVIIRAGSETPVFLDWARTRAGSPLEDVSSFLHWLGFWEPAAKRKHDTLLVRYLAAMGCSGHPSPALRASYWVASASNCLAGALRYHLAVMSDVQVSPASRAAARSAVYDCLRVLRRADASLAHQRSASSTSNETTRGA
jgi:hypothetical protein